MKVLSSFTHSQVIPNLYEFISSAEHHDIFKGTVSGHHWLPLYLFFHTMDDNVDQQLFG